MTTLTVPSRFSGPPPSGNGGDSCGVLGRYLDGAATVPLQRPVPLDRPLEVWAADDCWVRAFAADGGSSPRGGDLARRLTLGRPP